MLRVKHDTKGPCFMEKGLHYDALLDSFLLVGGARTSQKYFVLGILYRREVSSGQGVRLYMRSGL